MKSLTDTKIYESAATVSLSPIADGIELSHQADVSAHLGAAGLYWFDTSAEADAMLIGAGIFADSDHVFSTCWRRRESA